MELHIVLDSFALMTIAGIVSVATMAVIGVVAIRDVQPSRPAPVDDPYATGDWLYDCSDAESQEVLWSIDRLAVRHN